MCWPWPWSEPTNMIYIISDKNNVKYILSRNESVHVTRTNTTFVVTIHHEHIRSIHHRTAFVHMTATAFIESICNAAADLCPASTSYVPLPSLDTLIELIQTRTGYV